MFTSVRIEGVELRAIHLKRINRNDTSLHLEHLLSIVS